MRKIVEPKNKENYKLIENPSGGFWLVDVERNFGIGIIGNEVEDWRYTQLKKLGLKVKEFID